jgi:uncharacterized protein (DUF433 family)
MNEIVYARALEAVAMGATRDETFTDLLDGYPSVEASEIKDEMEAALFDAQKQGVEREDIDPSWF